jgi:hypothetical protein
MTVTWIKKKTCWYILVLYRFESTKKSIIIVLSSYFQILEIGAWHLFSCTCISKNVLTCILKHAIVQYYAMIKDFPLVDH